jgi:radical SAM protein with 4Fe4S-binding SPASM domain
VSIEASRAPAVAPITAPPAARRRSLAERLFRNAARMPKLSRASQVARTMLRHATPRKLMNLALIEAEYRLRRSRLRGKPYILVVDPLNVCNLRCPLCPTGLLTPNRKAQLMSWDTYTRSIDELAPWAFKVNLFNWGEPLLHPHVYDMIRYAAQRNLGTALSTNLSVELSDEQIDSIVTCGLEFLCLSIDGVTQETYQIYRKRGSIALVLSNLERLIARRRALKSTTPIIEWQFIQMRHNLSELDAAARMATELGVDLFRTIEVGLPFDSPDGDRLRLEWYPPKAAASDTNEPADSACYFLYRYGVVNPDAGVSPCCVVYGENTDFGNLATQRFSQIWNNDAFVSARNHYVTGGQISTATVCDRCHMFRKRTQPSAKFLRLHPQ